MTSAVDTRRPGSRRDPAIWHRLEALAMLVSATGLIVAVILI